MAHHRRRSCLRRVLTIAGGVSAGLLLLAGGHTYGHGQLLSPSLLPLGLGADCSPSFAPPPFAPPPSALSPLPPYLLSDLEADASPPQPEANLPRRLLPIHRSPPCLPSNSESGADRSPPQHDDADAVLLPDWEVLLLADAELGGGAGNGKATCAFQGGASSPASALGRLPGSARHGYVCPMPEPVRSLQPLQAPLLLPTSAASADCPGRTSLLNWSGPIAFSSATLDSGDVLIFAKGVNHAAGGVRCIYRHCGDAHGHGVVASFPAITSVQQVTRCPAPPMHLNSRNAELRVTVAATGEDPIPSIATYRPQQSQSGLVVTPARKKLICACTMVHNVSKFLREWVLYHAAVGVEHFFLYDNGSQDDFADQVAQLRSAGISITTVPWPWIKMQEAGFSHSAAMHQSSCKWMAFIDVDEFIFSPNWKGSEKPSKSMLEALLPVDPDVGQVYLWCFDFAPSGQTSHPQEGVIQGYTCRRKIILRHKSLVLLAAVNHSLENAIHHFTLKDGFRSIRNLQARVNHYKYQAWSEFKHKFKRRVSAYVADWRDPINLQSADRAPGLGLDGVEPVDWAQRYCDVKDNLLQQLSARWFGNGLATLGSQDT
ncbi:glycosyltransferase family 92 protein RCOM_0530710-like [Aegilops tauschii subsp. strangulata]|uniref:Glycosyltransferase family 92 protein n=2 Tax=Aegilops tauschii TaxID=37682 RepID=A0A453HDK3_AEGTS|nr:glycosyltransferase family 92 protein RCOM_0530710-like [Aegilops tauschii subsp. strangulata]